MKEHMNALTEAQKVILHTAIDNARGSFRYVAKTEHDDEERQPYCVIGQLGHLCGVTADEMFNEWVNEPIVGLLGWARPGVNSLASAAPLLWFNATADGAPIYRSCSLLYALQSYNDRIIWDDPAHVMRMKLAMHEMVDDYPTLHVKLLCDVNPQVHHPHRPPLVMDGYLSRLHWLCIVCHNTSDHPIHVMGPNLHT